MLANLKKKALEQPPLFAALLSLIIACLWYSYQQPINVDGIKYLKAAALFYQSGFMAAYHIFPWPFYPILISLLHQATGLSLLHAAYLINAISVALLSLSFVLVLRQLTDNLLLQWFGVFIIVFYPSLTHEHYMVIRDFAYYGFAFLSLYFLLRFLPKQRLMYALAWALSLILASLFRNEGLLFLAFAPIALFFMRDKTMTEKLSGFVKLNLLNLLGFVIVMSLLLLHQQDGRLFYHIVRPATHGIVHFFQLIHTHIETLKTDYFVRFGASSAKVFFIGGTLFVFVSLLVKTLGYINTAFILYGLKQRVLKIQQPALCILLAYIIINIALLLAFQFSQLFTTTRYMMFLAMILLLIVPFALADIFQRFPFTLHNRLNWQASLAIALMGYLFISASFHLGADRAYYQTAGNWVAQHTAKQDKFFVNDLRLSFYIDRPLVEALNRFPSDRSSVSYTLTAKLQRYHIDYAALLVRNNHVAKVKAFLKSHDLHILKAFSNNHHDKIFIVTRGQTHG